VCSCCAMLAAGARPRRLPLCARHHQHAAERGRAQHHQGPGADRAQVLGGPGGKGWSLVPSWEGARAPSLCLRMSQAPRTEGGCMLAKPGTLRPRQLLPTSPRCIASGHAGRSMPPCCARHGRALHRSSCRVASSRRAPHSPSPALLSAARTLMQRVAIPTCACTHISSPSTQPTAATAAPHHSGHPPHLECVRVHVGAACARACWRRCLGLTWCCRGRRARRGWPAGGHRTVARRWRSCACSRTSWALSRTSWACCRTSWACSGTSWACSRTSWACSALPAKWVDEQAGGRVTGVRVQPQWLLLVVAWAWDLGVKGSCSLDGSTADRLAVRLLC
jgi:hypothetical protein